MAKHPTTADEPREKFNLNYKIVGKRQGVPGDSLNLIHYDVEWTHAGGPVKDYEVHHQGGKADDQANYHRQAVGEREVIKDTITVPANTAQATVVQMLEDKRERLAQSLGVEP